MMANNDQSQAAGDLLEKLVQVNRVAKVVKGAMIQALRQRRTDGCPHQRSAHRDPST